MFDTYTFKLKYKGKFYGYREGTNITIKENIVYIWNYNEKLNTPVFIGSVYNFSAEV